MRIIAPVASYLILLGVVIPSILFYAGKLTFEPMKLWMLITTIAWFVVTPFWMGRKSS